MQRRKRPVNRNEVARQAKVSPSTVSLVLNATAGRRISETTRQRVTKVAHRLGYRTNALAKALVTGRTMTIGVVLHYADRPFVLYSSSILDGFWKAMLPHHYRLLLVTGRADSCVAGLYRERSIDGLMVIAAPAKANDPELRSLVEARFPAVFVGTRLLRLATDYVDIDNLATARQATEELIRAGHREILHIAGPLRENSAAIARKAGYLAALRAACLPPRKDLVIEGSFVPEHAKLRLTEAMQAGLRFTAIFAASIGMGMAAAEVLRARGLRVPEDVSIIGIDDAGSSGFISFEQPLQEIGMQTANLLVERMRGGHGPPRSLLLPCRRAGGTSVAPPPGEKQC